jgi:hypothetical protein
MRGEIEGRGREDAGIGAFRQARVAGLGGEIGGTIGAAHIGFHRLDGKARRFEARKLQPGIDPGRIERAMHMPFGGKLVPAGGGVELHGGGIRREVDIGARRRQRNRAPPARGQWSRCEIERDVIGGAVARCLRR